MSKIDSNLRLDLDIAVIGISGRFPGADTIDEYWNNLKNGVHSITTFTDEELEESGVDRDSIDNPDYVKARGIINDIEYFDTSLFGYKSSEAKIMDPQMRVFHECVWEALEDAGYNTDTHNRSIGLYAGASPNLFWELLTFKSKSSEDSEVFTKAIYNNKDHLSSRISYQLNLNGPSVYLRTQCSTSLVGIHMAGQALLSGDCDIALAGGISITLPAKSGYLYQQGMITSPDGVCRPFDADANGTVFSSGAGVVVLKRLGEALDDGDNIYAVIRGSSINNDGNKKINYTSPGIDGQQKVIKNALNFAEVKPESISYIEAHATATSLGDPIEIEALKLAFDTDKRGYCAIGSVKSNIGHLDTASGIAGFIKTVLALKHKMIPPSLHYNKPNPKIDFDNSPFFVNTTLTEWKNDTYPLRAGVSSFGVGGTNAHIILEEAPVVDDAPAMKDNHLILLSAKTETSLTNGIARLKDYLTQNQKTNLADLAYTLQIGRKELEHRKALVCRTVQEAVEKLTTPDDTTQAVVNNEQAPQVVFMFPGQGSHYPGMAKKLYETEQVFKDTVDTCYTMLNKIHPQTVYHTMFEAGFNAELLDDEQIAAISIFIIEYSLAQLLIGLGIKPYAMIGDTIGEYTAACLAGVFTLEDALKLVSTCTNPGEFNAVATIIDYNAPTIAYISNVDGNWTDIDAVQSPDYWIQQRADANNLKQGIQLLNDLENPLFIEVGPGNTLSSLVNTNNQKINNVIPLFIHNLAAPDDAAQFLNALGALWLNGLKITWHTYYHNEKRRRISLPTYSFDRKRYWLKGNPFTMSNEITAKNDMNKKSDIGEWFYVPSWKRSVLNDHITKETVKDFTWLVLTDDLGVGSQLITALKKEGATVLGAAPGTQFSRTDDGMYTLNTMNHDEYITLLNDIDTSKPLKIIHLWGLTADGHDETDPDYVKSLQPLIFHSLINLTRALGTLNNNSPIEILVCTNGLHQVTGEETLHPGKATVLGPVNVIPREYPNITCRSCDFSITPQKEQGHIIYQLLHETMSGTHDKVLAYRGMYRWVQVFEPHRLEKSETIPHRLKDHGVYLITGGLGGIGLTLAECIAENVKATLVLIGRSDFPDKTTWNDPSVTHDENNPVQNKIIKLRKIMDSGSDIVVVKGDSADYVRMNEIITDIKNKYGTIDGVIHTAGVIDNSGIIQKRTPEMNEKVFAPKIYGTLILKKLLKGLNPDFFILCSSLSSITAPIGEVAYCSANAFLNSFSAYRAEDEQYFKTSINWDAWNNIGMSNTMINTINRNSIKNYNIDHLMSKSIKAEEGVDVFYRCLNTSLPVVYVSTFTLSKRLHSDRYKPVKSPGNKKHSIKEVETLFINWWKEIFDAKTITPSDDYFSLGGDSITAIQLISLANKENIFISSEQIFNYPTIKELSKNIVMQQSSRNTQVNNENVDTLEEKAIIDSEIDEKDVKTIQEKYDLTTIENVFYLTSMQLAVLNYNLMFKKSQKSIQVFSCTLNGAINSRLFEEAWQAVINNHAILRTTFIWRKLTAPVQVVFKEIKAEINTHDYKHVSKENQQSVISEYLETEKQTGFKIGEAPLFRLHLIKLSEDKYYFIFSYQNSLFDGWSLNVIFNDLLRIYTSLKQNQTYSLPKPHSFYHYYSRLKNQKIEDAKQFWKNEFEGYVFDDSDNMTINENDGIPAVQDMIIPGLLNIKLKNFIKKNALTINTVLSGCWAILQSQMLNKDDILLAFITSGRPADLSGIESIVGLFTNTLPIRVKIEHEVKIIDWLKQLQELQMKIRRLESITIQQIAQWTQIPLNVFQKVVYEKTIVYNNFPMNVNVEEKNKYMTINNILHTGEITVPMRLYIYPDDQLTLSIHYNKQHYNDEQIQVLLEKFKLLLHKIIISNDLLHNLINKTL